METKKRVLVAPLDWGLGHAARCIPIIRELLSRNCEVLIASNGRSLYLLEKEFPLLTFFTLSAYNPIYPEGNASMIHKMGFQLPKFMGAIRNEGVELRTIAEKNSVDLIISDNRYGCYHSRIKSVFITHQLNILMPSNWKWMEKAVNWFNHKRLEKFDECWVPATDMLPLRSLVDTGQHGDLKIRRIGLLSRMAKKCLPPKYRVCVICSGPEPQRTIFEEMLTEQLKDKDYPSILIRSKTETINPYYKKNVQHVIANYLTSDEMNTVIEESDIIISRPGYSTLMDLAKLGKKAIFVPTPGQTEQEYLAEELMSKGVALSVKQSEFDLESVLKESNNYTGFANFEQDELSLKNIIDSVL